jgi:hypothetical protein
MDYSFFWYDNNELRGNQDVRCHIVKLTGEEVVGEREGLNEGTIDFLLFEGGQQRSEKKWSYANIIFNQTYW